MYFGGDTKSRWSLLSGGISPECDYAVLNAALHCNKKKKISRGFLMAEELYLHLSSEFTREDTSSLHMYQKQSLMDQRWEGMGQL